MLKKRIVLIDAPEAKESVIYYSIILWISLTTAVVQQGCHVWCDRKHKQQIFQYSSTDLNDYVFLISHEINNAHAMVISFQVPLVREYEIFNIKKSPML